MDDDAELIADILTNTDSDEVGELLLKVADQLRLRSQYYTARLIRATARTYGYPEQDKEE